MDEAVQRGDSLFFGKAACGRCHLGDLFTDARFHNLGVGFDPASGRFRDRGRAAVTGREEDLGAFKTPTLRDVALHPPFMHDGSMKDLETVMDHYVKGGTPNPHLSERMEPLQLTSAERADLIAMMRALTGEGHADTAPALFPR